MAAKHAVIEKNDVMFLVAPTHVGYSQGMPKIARVFYVRRGNVRINRERENLEAFE